MNLTFHQEKYHEKQKFICSHPFYVQLYVLTKPEEIGLPVLKWVAYPSLILCNVSFAYFINATFEWYTLLQNRLGSQAWSVREVMLKIT